MQNFDLGKLGLNLSKDEMKQVRQKRHLILILLG